MDHDDALRQLQDRATLSSAFAYALFDRLNSDYFYDPIEIEWAQANRELILDDLHKALQNPDMYMPLAGFAHFPPKNDLCDRRMIHIPIKDLTLRYAFAMIFSETLEARLDTQCFANRRAKGDDAKVRFKEDFASGGWKRFCEWQEARCGDNSVLLRTDISSFYDSVSHRYLVDAVCKHLSLNPASVFVQLFERILKVPVIQYSSNSDQIKSSEPTQQGLPIGDGVEGYFANIYLLAADDAMLQDGAEYGRYVDDIRIFGSDRRRVLHNLRVLQEELLRIGLNLNSAKTEIAENEEQKVILISRLYRGEDSSPGEAVEEEEETAGVKIEALVDRPFEMFTRVFEESEKLQKKDAKDFCKFISGHGADGKPLLPLQDREDWHIDGLRTILEKWRSSAKHASWLLVQTAFWKGVKEGVSKTALKTVMDLVSDTALYSYARYRLLHHIVKRRKGRRGEFSFLDQLTDEYRSIIESSLPSLLGESAFELNLIALYILRQLGHSEAELEAFVNANCKPGCEPVYEALRRNTTTARVAIPSLVTDKEPDETPSYDS